MRPARFDQLVSLFLLHLGWAAPLLGQLNFAETEIQIVRQDGFGGQQITEFSTSDTFPSEVPLVHTWAKGTHTFRGTLSIEAPETTPQFTEVAGPGEHALLGGGRYDQAEA